MLLRKSDSEAFLFSHHGWPHETINGFFGACRYFCITYCSARRVTTIDFKGLLYLMCFLFLFVLFFFLALIKVFYVYDNICSIV